MHLRHSKGLAALAVLLARPHTDVHVLELATADAESARTAREESRGADVLDRTALAAYRRRLAELDDEQAEAADQRTREPRLPGAVWLVLASDAASAVGSGMTMPFLLNPEEIRFLVPGEDPRRWAVSPEGRQLKVTCTRSAAWP